MKIDTSTAAGKDKKLASLYLARGEGKIIQHRDIVGKWFDTPLLSQISYSFRIKPQTVEEAADIYVEDNTGIVVSHNTVGIAFEAGAKWQKDQDNVQQSKV